MTSARKSDAPGSDGAAWSRSELEGDRVPEPDAINLSLREINALSRAFERRLGTVLTVNPTDLQAMEHLISSGPLTPSELATRLGVTTAASTLVVDRLVALGHVERHPHQHDRRKIVVVPARSSVDRAVDELMPVMFGVASLAASLSPSDREVVERFLASVASVYRAAVDAPLDPA
ncbi:MAG: MarR family winged helix-turn-helix transcriptional regulator [Herbiconiux sp.]|nr:MarR family winged helix-turn-helix transcriptional regulator [Herbiconiux sp.]